MTISDKDNKQGLLIVYTGDGKGKTTAALGMTVRAVGYDWKICIVQFIKGSWKYGELEGIKRLAPNVELTTVGEGFVGIVDDKKDIEEHRSAATKGLKLAVEKIKSGGFQLVILDEINVALQLKLVDRSEVEAIIDQKPTGQHLVLAGRNAPDWLVERADLVTEMKEVKHPFKSGLKARKGIDW